MSQQCKTLTVDQQNRGKLVSHVEAKEFLNEYLESDGETQPHRSDLNHVFGFLFGLNVIREMISRIDRHNVDVVDANEQITALRIYRAKSKRDGDSAAVSDLLIVPVTRSGEDFPESLTNVANTNMIVCNSGPCPNLCTQVFGFFRR